MKFLDLIESLHKPRFSRMIQWIAPDKTNLQLGIHNFLDLDSILNDFATCVMHKICFQKSPSEGLLETQIKFYVCKKYVDCTHLLPSFHHSVAGAVLIEDKFVSYTSCSTHILFTKSIVVFALNLVHKPNEQIGGGNDRLIHQETLMDSRAF